MKKESELKYVEVGAMDLEDWEEDLLRRYPEGSTNAEGKDKEQFRDYKAEVRPEVKEFY